MYKGQHIISEFLQDQIEKHQLQDLGSSPFYSLMIDETTDVATVKVMVMYAHYLDLKNEVLTALLKDMSACKNSFYN